MLPFVLAMQVGGAPLAPPPAPVTAPLSAPAPSTTAPPYPAPPPSSSAPPPPAYPAPPPGYEPAPQPYPYGYGPPPGQTAPPGYYPPSPGYGQPPPGYYAPPPEQLPRPRPVHEPPTWFIRGQIALGTPGFSTETSLLRLEGYGGAKFWFELDGGYYPRLASGNAGIGLWAALSYWSSKAGDSAPKLQELSYFIGPEIPLRFGSRQIAFFAAPRIGLAVGKLDLGGAAPSQSAFAYGAQLGAVSSLAHLTFALNLLRATVGPPGAVGRDHDLGGFSFSIGGLFDDG